MTTTDEALADEVLEHFLRLEKMGLMVDRVELPRAYVSALTRTGSIRKHEGRWKLWGAPVRVGKRLEVIAADPAIVVGDPSRLVLAKLVSVRGKVTVKTTRMKQLWVRA